MSVAQNQGKATKSGDGGDILGRRSGCLLFICTSSDTWVFQCSVWAGLVCLVIISVPGALSILTLPETYLVGSSSLRGWCQKEAETVVLRVDNHLMRRASPTPLGQWGVWIGWNTEPAKLLLDGGLVSSSPQWWGKSKLCERPFSFFFYPNRNWFSGSLCFCWDRLDFSKHGTITSVPIILSV